MDTSVYDKTDKGREEIATRKHHLSAKLRTQLLLIDGRHQLDALLKEYAAANMTCDTLRELLAEGYIYLVSGGPVAEPVPPEAHPRPKHLRPLAKASAARLAAFAAGVEPSMTPA